PQAFVVAGLPAIALAGAGVLARLGGERRWARVSTLVVGGLMVAGIGAALLGISSAALLPNGSAPTTETSLKLALLFVGLSASSVLGLLALLPRTRRALAAFLPFDPTSFPASVGVAAVLTTTAMAAVPLLVLAAPPLLSLVATMPEAIGDGS